jgi:YidC/Oxa1 family membrane protein insertase
LTCSSNFGVAIIALTIIVRLFMYPVAQKQFASMAGMRAVQPKMKALQERYKDDKPKLQQEMMKLYQEEKINPAGGLPAHPAADSRSSSRSTRF